MGAGFVLQAWDKASHVLRRVGRNFGRLRSTVKKASMGMNNSMANTAMGYAALQAGLGLVKLSKTTADAAGKFQQSLAAVGQVARATSEELDMLHDAAIEAALGTKFSPDETIEGLQTLSAMGLKARESVEALNPVLELATGSLGQLGVAGAADAVVGTIKAMGYEIGQAADVTNKLLKITQMTNFQARDFSVSMGRVGSTAKLYKQSLEDALITMGLMRNMNIEATVASTSLREAWRRLAADQRAQQAVEAQGVEIFKEKDGSIRDMLGIMTQLVEKTQDLTDKERMRLTTIAFGVRGMAAFNAVANATYTVMKGNEKILLEGTDAINAMRYELSIAGETLDDQQKASLRAALGVKSLNDVLKTSVRVSEQFKDALLETYEGQKQLVSGAWQTLMVVIGEDFAKAMQPAAKALYELISSITLFIKSMSPQAKQMVLKFAVALGVLAAAGGGLLILSGITNMLGGSLLGFVFSIGKLLLIGAPLLVILSGLGVGFTSLAKAMNLFGKDGMDIKTIMEKVRLAASGMMSILSGEEFSDDLRANLDKAENKGIVKFLKSFSRWVDRVKVFWKGLVAGFNQGVEMLSKSSAFAAFRDKLEGIIRIFTGSDAENSPKVLEQWAERGAEAGRYLARLGETAADIAGKLIGFGKSFYEFIKDIEADDIRDAIMGIVDAFNTIGTVIQGVKTGIGTLYYFVKMVISAILEALTFLANGLGYGVDSIWAKLFGSKQDEKKVQDYYKRILDPSKAFEWTSGAAGDLADLQMQMADKMQQNEDRDAQYARRERQAKELNRLTKRKRQIEEWVGATPEQWAAMTKGTGAEGNIPFSAASKEMQAQFMNELAGINKRLEKMAGTPINVSLDGEKLAQIVGRQPSMTGEDSLEEVAVAPGF